ncbi:hypothetical protein KM043_004718 [Ampulex compressa]|nr:hypothetical protein KM043_004718 [Ampulex compressa]
MTIGDMDIRLNVTSEPTTDGTKLKKRKADGRKKALKRLKGSILRKREIPGDKSTGQARARVKQKSLSAIVVRNLKANKASVVPKSDTSLDTHSQNPVPASNIQQGVSFVKNTEENCSKSLLARKRPNPGTKKSLSEIFLKSAEPEEALSDPRSSVQKQSIEEPKKQKLEGRKHEGNNARTFSNNGKLQKKQKSAFQGKKENLSNIKQGGKISSLFGNNPEVPNIGQRLVKPINEPVFTKLNFTDLNVHPFMVSNLEQNLGITTMTTVQQKAIPQVLSGKDVLIRSQTGSGKTLSYALPIVELLQKIRPKLSRNSGLRALVVVPTRELVLQTYECFLKLVKPFTWIVPGYLLGGEKRKAEKARLRKGCNILVATPGRLLDHVKHTTALKLHEVRYFVIDEADRMLDMGYEKDMSGIVEALKVTSTDYNLEYHPMQLLRKNNNTLMNKEESPKETAEEKSMFDEESGSDKMDSEPQAEYEEEENASKKDSPGC